MQKVFILEFEGLYLGNVDGVLTWVDDTLEAVEFSETEIDAVYDEVRKTYNADMNLVRIA